MRETAETQLAVVSQECRAFRNARASLERAAAEGMVESNLDGFLELLGAVTEAKLHLMRLRSSAHEPERAKWQRLLLLESQREKKLDHSNKLQFGVGMESLKDLDLVRRVETIVWKKQLCDPHSDELGF